MKNLSKNIFASVAALALLATVSGCAEHRHHHYEHDHDHQPGMGAAPAGVTGSAHSSALQNSIPNRPRLSEPLQTETITPGVGSALFPNADGR